MSIESRGQSEFDDIIFSPLTCLSSFHYDQLTVFCVLYICKKIWCLFFSRSESFMSWNVWWFGADPLTTSAFHSFRKHGLATSKTLPQTLKWNRGTTESTNTGTSNGHALWVCLLAKVCELYVAPSRSLSHRFLRRWASSSSPGHWKASSFYTSPAHSSNT